MDETNIREREILPRQQGDPLAQAEWNNRWYSSDEVAELQRRYAQEIKEQWEQTTQGQLCLSFYRAFVEYKNFMEAHTHAKRNPAGQLLEYDEHKLFEEGLRLVERHKYEREEALRQNLAKAQRAARCRHIHANGRQCGAPRVKGKKLCHMHERMLQDVPVNVLDLGPMEDPDSIQLGIRKLQSAILGGQAGLQAGGTAGVHDPVGGVECDENVIDEAGRMKASALPELPKSPELAIENQSHRGGAETLRKSKTFTADGHKADRKKQKGMTL